MSAATTKPDEATAEENATRTREGDAHSDHVETTEESRGAVQRWGFSSPGGNTGGPAGDSPESDTDEKRAHES